MLTVDDEICMFRYAGMPRLTFGEANNVVKWFLMLPDVKDSVAELYT